MALTCTPWPNLWVGLAEKADDIAVAEHALRAVARAQVRPWTKTDLVMAVTSICARRWGWHGRYDNPAALIRGQTAVRCAFDRLVAAGVIIWHPHQKLRFP